MTDLAEAEVVTKLVKRRHLGDRLPCSFLEVCRP